MNRRTFLYKALGVTTVGFFAGSGIGFIVEADEKPKTPTPTTPSFGHHWLNIETELGATQHHHTLLDEIVTASLAIYEREKRTIQGTPGEEQYDSSLRKAFFHSVAVTLNARHFEPSDQAPSLLHEALEPRLIDDKQVRLVKCDTASAIYLAVAEQAQVPIFGVLTPCHMFVRWDPNGKHNALITNDPINNQDYSWESQNNMGGLEDSFYIQERGFLGFPIDTDSLPYTDCMKSLPLTQSLSIAHYNAALEFEHQYAKTPDKHFLNQALYHLNEAINLVPGFFKFYMVRSSIHQQLGDTKAAQEDKDKQDELIVRKAYAPNAPGLPQAV